MTDIATVRTDRHLGIGSSDARRLINNDWLTLYNEKVGLSEPEDLSNIFRVQLGILTETFHLDWLAKVNECPISRPAERYTCPTYEFMYAHLDGWHDQADTFVEVKHSNCFKTVRQLAVDYMAQLQHQMIVTERTSCYFSAICGNSDPEWVIVDANPEYQERLVEIERTFWWHVKHKVAPEITPTAKQEQAKKVGASTRIDGLIPYDMGPNNHWASLAHDYLANQQAAALFEQSKKAIKELVPDDASEAAGHGLAVRRDRRGALRFYELEGASA